jgi:hypothetical protein
MRIRRAIICSSTVWVAGLLLMGHPAAFAQTAPAPRMGGRGWFLFFTNVNAFGYLAGERAQFR